MKLNYKRLKASEGPTLIILHGLYGASDNWFSLSKEWSENYDVIAVDLRNHGRSPHSSVHNYDALCKDVIELMDDLEINKSVILGHSMGGKVAMRMAVEFPQRIEALIVVDIAPKNYLPGKDENIAKHQRIIKGMLGLDLSKINKREDVDTILSPSIPEFRTRQFIMKNLKRAKDGTFQWKLNIHAIAENIEAITGGFSEDKFNMDTKGFPVLFIKGEDSNYIQDEDMEAIYKLFPGAELHSIANAGHWIHAEQSEALSEAVLEFLEDLY